MSRGKRQRYTRRVICAGDANCCRKLILILQLADIERICAETGWHPRRFVRLYRPDEFLKGDDQEDVWIETARGQRIMGTRRRGDGCCFLQGGRCLIYPFRPLNCTMYPLDCAYPGGRLVMVRRREKWCGAQLRGLVPVEEHLRLGRQYNREARRTDRFVRAWNRQTKRRATGAQFIEHLAEYVRRHTKPRTQRLGSLHSR